MLLRRFAVCFSVCGLIVAAGLIASAAAQAQQTPQPMRVVAFAGASNLPFWAAQQKGFFKREGVDPSLDITLKSTDLAQDLYAGRFDMALTSVDNVIAYDEGQGEAELPGPADFVALFGVDNGMLHIMTAPEVKSFAELKGKTISVDAMTTGFAFVLRDILEKNGLKDGDVNFVRVGGGAQRLQALLNHEQTATLLNTPLDLVAESKGFHRLASARDVFGAYQGIVGVARRETAPKSREKIEAFIRGFHAAVAWLGDGANRGEAVALLEERMRGMAHTQAERAYDQLLDPQNGIHRDLAIDREGLKTVLRLRSQYGQPKKLLDDPDRYVDASYLKAAMGK
jgi:ABC-type nitrate/sulfonate/bicarbonate transport system substrate-binding protein